MAKLIWVLFFSAFALLGHAKEAVPVAQDPVLDARMVRITS